MPERLTVHAGPHPRRHCPLRVAWPYPDAPTRLTLGERPLPVQRDGETLVFFPLPLEAGEQAIYTTADGPVEDGVRLEDAGEYIRVLLDGEEFTRYWYKEVPARPYFWPVLAPGDIPVTRAYPMADVPGEMQDHPHHRSLYFAHGAVNGADNWSEEAGHGCTLHRSIDELVSGPVFGRLATTGAWADQNHRPLLTQKLSVTFWRGDDGLRLMDVDLTLIATEGEVLFGDTKEGGLLSIRVATDLDVEKGRGGRITNAYGGIDERETWGKAAHWCDYSGKVGGQDVGIAVMDHPLSTRYPTYWHVRDYGLMAANPFGLAAYTGGAKEGSFLLKAGESLNCLYRVLVHRGDAETAEVRRHYLNFVSPPRVEVHSV